MKGFRLIHQLTVGTYILLLIVLGSLSLECFAERDYLGGILTLLLLIVGGTVCMRSLLKGFNSDE